jgi:hypothetical protein
MPARVNIWPGRWKSSSSATAQISHKVTFPRIDIHHRGTVGDILFSVAGVGL